jgi:hypothetical protein
VHPEPGSRHSMVDHTSLGMPALTFNPHKTARGCLCGLVIKGTP